MKPLISVIVPVYKVEQYIEKCVNSLLNQTYTNLEIILVDDGSPDKCPTICDDYALACPNISVYHKQNGGLGSARNYGVEKSRGSLIAFVDSDDYVEPEYIEDLWKLISKFQADIAVTRIVREFEGTHILEKENLFDDFQVSNNEMILSAYSGGGRINWGACGKLFNKNVLLRHPFPPGLYEDAAVMYKIFHDCTCCAVGDYKYNYHYIAREGSILISTLEKKHFHIFNICEDFSLFIKQYYHDIDIVCVLFYRRAVTQLLNLQKMDKEMYNGIFVRYRSFFRSNLFKVLKDKRVSIKAKYYIIWLCTTPLLYKLQYRISKFFSF